MDLAGKSKLFSLIVDDLEAAKAVLEINKQLKGGVINIYPLTIIGDLQQKDRNYPPAEEAHPLYKCVSLKHDSDPRLGNLIFNLFSKIVLVKSY